MAELGIAGPPWPQAAARPADTDDRRASLLFVHAALISAICLQRFCIYVGGSPLYWCLPVFLLLVGWMLVTGRARLRLVPLILLGGFTAAAALTTLVAINSSDLRISGVSLPSLASLLLLYLGLLAAPTHRFDRTRTLGAFVFYARLCAALGIAQYAAQFAGVRLFSFMEAAPALRPILVEPLFNYHPVVAYGSSVLRSNGFFLVEPSTFSQLLMLAVVVDVFARQEWRWLPLYGLAYLLSYSGTGLLALAIACALAIVLAPRSAPRLLAFAAVTLLLGAIASLALPQVFDALMGRANEISYSGSSAHARYVTQLDLLATVAGETRTLIGYGPGALERASFYVPGGASPALKLFIDYGVIGLLTFAAFLITVLWRRDLALISLYILVNFQLGGGNLLFMPLVVLAAVLCVWSAPPPTSREEGEPT